MRKRNEIIQIFQGKERRSLIVSPFTNCNATYVCQTNGVKPVIMGL